VTRPRLALLWLYDALQVQVCAIRDVADLRTDDRLQDQEAMFFSIRADDPLIEYVQADRLVRLEDRVYQITSLVQARTRGEAVVKVECEVRWVELSRRVRVGATTLLGRTNLQGLTSILAGSGWAVGSVPADATLYSIDELDETITFLLRRWGTVTGTEVVFDSLNKTVSLVEAQGDDLGVGFRYGHNVRTITRRYEPPIVTRLYPFGANGLTIAAVNPSSLEYIENYDWYIAQGLTLAQAQARYRKDQVWSDERYLLSLNLYDAAVRRLNLLAQPVVSYEMDVLDLFALTGAGQPVAIGDTVTVRDDTFGVDLKTRTVRVERHPNAPWLDRVELQYLQRTITDSELEVGGREVDVGRIDMLADSNTDPFTITSSVETWAEIAITVAGETSFAAGATLRGVATGTGTVQIQMTIDGTPEVPVYEFPFVAGQFEFSWPTFATGITEGSYLIDWRARVISGTGTIAVAAQEARAWILIRGAVGVGVNSNPSQSVADVVEYVDILTVSDAVSAINPDHFEIEIADSPEYVAVDGFAEDYLDDLGYWRLGTGTFSRLDGPGVLGNPGKVR